MRSFIIITIFLASILGVNASENVTFGTGISYLNTQSSAPSNFFGYQVAADCGQAFPDGCFNSDGHWNYQSCQCTSQAHQCGYC